MKTLFAIILLAFCIQTATAQENGKNFIDQNYIEVAGKAEMEIVPDQIYLKIIINEKENKDKLTVEELEQAMVAKIKDIGLDVEKDLAIKDFVSNFKSYWLKKTDIITTKEYQLLVHNARTAGQVFQELERIGISNITIDRIDHSEIEKFRQEVKINAIKAAKTKGEYLTEAIGQNIGRAIYINEVGNRIYSSIEMRSVSGSNIVIRGNAKESPSYDIEFEKIKLNYSILVRFELK